MANILILVGTESGNAQMVADALKPVLDAAGHAVDVTDKAATKSDLEAHDVLLVVCATHGSGDIPTNILPLAETLERERPDLSGHRYGVIALGDMTYQDTYCGGGKKVDKVLQLPLQAVRQKDGKPIVYVQAGAGFEPRPVKVTYRTESRVGVEGVDEGAVIALVDPQAAARTAGKSNAPAGPGGVK